MFSLEDRKPEKNWKPVLSTNVTTFLSWPHGFQIQNRALPAPDTAGCRSRSFPARQKLPTHFPQHPQTPPPRCQHSYTKNPCTLTTEKDVTHRYAHPVNEGLQKPSFGDTLFSGGRFIFWCLGPLFLLVAVVFAGIACTQFATGRFGAGGIALAVAVVCVCFFLALLNGPYFWWAGRVVAASIFCAYLWYLIDAWLIHPKPIDISGARSAATPWNALLGLLIIGWPCVLYTFLGRFTLRVPPPPDEFVTDYDDEAEQSDNERPNDNNHNAS